jgi:regulator of RNase E activity RraA
MPDPRPTASALDSLRSISVPTLANAIETFGVVPPDSGYCDSSLRCHYPEMPLMLGYAVTAHIGSGRPRTGVVEAEYWRFVSQQPGPKIAVIQDIDDPPRGAIWGEWNANVHRALGCVGMVTQGAARDLDGVQKLGFHFFSTHVLPSHAYATFLDFGDPIVVAGLTVRTGDLLAGDRHGVLVIPAEIPLDELAETAAEIDRLEARIFQLCQSPGFTLEQLVKLDRETAARWPGADR